MVYRHRSGGPCKRGLHCQQRIGAFYSLTKALRSNLLFGSEIIRKLDLRALKKF